MKLFKSIIALLLVLATLLGVTSCTVRESVSICQEKSIASADVSNASTESPAANHKEKLSFAALSENLDTAVEAGTSADAPAVSMEEPDTAAPSVSTDSSAEPDRNGAPATREPDGETTAPSEPDKSGKPAESVETSAPVTETITPESDSEFITNPEAPALPEHRFTHDELVFAFAIECIASDLTAAGFDVFEGYVRLEDTLIQGLIFTDYSLVSESEDGMTVFHGGFIQIEDADHPASVRLTDELLAEGVIAVDGLFEDECYLIDYVADVENWSGIVDDSYFVYEQATSSVISVRIAENTRSSYRRDVTLFNYDIDRYVFKPDLSYSGTSAIGLQVNEQARYDNALDAVNAIIAAQSMAEYTSEQGFTVVLSAELVDEWILNSQHGFLNDFSLEALAEYPLEKNQFIYLTEEGPCIYTIPDYSELARQRVAKGIMNTLGGALIILSVVVTAASLGTAAPVVTGVFIVAGSVATAYAASNIIAGVQDIVLGSRGDVTTHAVNPLLDSFKAIMDDDTATKLYHGIGMTASTIVSLVIPTNAAINMATKTQASVGAAVVRVIGVELAKDVVIGGLSAGGAALASSITTELTGSEFWGMIAGCTAAITVGAFAAWGANKLDKHFNLNGLHAKPVTSNAANRFTTSEVEFDGSRPPREGDWGTYGDLKKAISQYKKSLYKSIQESLPGSDEARYFQDLLDEANSWEVHHVPGNTFMSKYHISRKDGMAMVLPKKYHRETFTCGTYTDVSPNVPGTNNKFYNSLTPDEAMRIDMSNMRAVLDKYNVLPNYEKGLIAFEKAIRNKYSDLMSSYRPWP